MSRSSSGGNDVKTSRPGGVVIRGLKNKRRMVVVGSDGARLWDDCVEL